MKVTNEQFENLMKQYHSVFNRWFRHASRTVKIDRETFTSDFQFILLKAIEQFDIDKVTSENDHFERYFVSSLKKYVNTLQRQMHTAKHKLEKQTVSLSEKSFNLCDTKSVPVDQELIAGDLLSYCRKRVNDYGVSELRMHGYQQWEICDVLHISPVEYRKILGKTKANSSLQKTLSSD